MTIEELQELLKEGITLQSELKIKPPREWDRQLIAGGMWNAAADRQVPLNAALDLMIGYTIHIALPAVAQSIWMNSSAGEAVTTAIGLAVPAWLTKAVDEVMVEVNSEPDFFLNNVQCSWADMTVLATSLGLRQIRQMLKSDAAIEVLRNYHGNVMADTPDLGDDA